MGENVNFNFLIGKPSAWLPVAFSAVALALVLFHLYAYGAVREADEGTSAHLFQAFVIVQLPIAAFFAIKWLPKSSKPALCVLALQTFALVSVIGSVYWFGL